LAVGGLESVVLVLAVAMVLSLTRRQARRIG
jgi:hypothetical protein